MPASERSPFDPLGSHLNLGWIPYLNLLPLQSEIKKLLPKARYVEGLPSQVNRWLNEGKVDVAPCSSINLLLNSQLELAAPVGIAAEGPVHSVYLGLHREHQEFLEYVRDRQRELREIFVHIYHLHGSDLRQVSTHLWQMGRNSAVRAPVIIPRLVLTPASATSSVLSRLLLRLWLGDASYSELAVICNGGQDQRESQMRPIELLIGDEALVRRPQFAAVLDLGQCWYEITGLPFVYALWQMQAKFEHAATVRRALYEAAELAAAKMHVEPKSYLAECHPMDTEGSPVDLIAYWNSMDYCLTQQHFRGLLLFFGLARHLIPSTLEENAVVRIARWHGAVSEMQNI